MFMKSSTAKAVNRKYLRLTGLAPGIGPIDRQGRTELTREWAEKIGWGGRIRTFTVLINSEVSYQLDHAPAVWKAAPEKAKQGRLRHDATGD